MDLLDLNLIDPGEAQPRKTFYEDSLAELAQSIRERGVLEPIVVRPVPDGRYRIVMGERRYRACRLAGLTHIPAIIRQLSDEEAAIDSLLENFQREDLNPVERAHAVRDLLKFMSWERCSKTLGASQTTLKRYLELLELPESVQRELARRDCDDGSFLEGHARLLRAFGGDEKTLLRLVQKIKAEKLSIDDTAELIAAIRKMPAKTEAFLRVPLNVTEEILRNAGRAGERKKAFKPQTAEQHMKQMLKTAAAMSDLLVDSVIDYLSDEQGNQLLSAVSNLEDAVVKFRELLRGSLKRNVRGFKEIYINCPLCGRIELVGSLRCAVCWTVLRRCYDCGNYDQTYQRCGITVNSIYMSEAESPNENSASYKCETYKARFEPRRAA